MPEQITPTVKDLKDAWHLWQTTDEAGEMRAYPRDTAYDEAERGLGAIRHKAIRDFMGPPKWVCTADPLSATGKCKPTDRHPHHITFGCGWRYTIDIDQAGFERTWGKS